MPPFPLAGPRRAAFPALIGTTKALRRPGSNTGSLMDSLTRPNVDPSVRSATAPDRAAWPGPAQARCRWLCHIGRCSGAPRFLCSPFHAFATLYDPGQSGCAHLSAQPVPPPPNRKRRHPALGISGLNHAASASAAYASARTVTHPRARLASGWWLAFTGRESNPLDCSERFPLVVALASPFPRFSLALLSCA